jgi:hypothetical protein
MGGGGGKGGGGGGGNVTTTETTYQYDPVASRKMAEIAGKQQEMAEQQWAMYQEYMLPYELEAIKANREILPLITEASKTTLGLQADPTREFYRQAQEGVDVQRRMDEAGAEVVSAAGLGQQMRRREISRYGIDPSSTAFAGATNLANIATARGVAGARTTAQRQAEQEQFSRLGFSLGRGVYQTAVGPQADPYSRAAGSYAQAAGSQGTLASRVLGTTGTTTTPYTGPSPMGSAIGGAIGAVGGYFAGGGTMQGAQAGYGIGSGIGGLF